MTKNSIAISLDGMPTVRNVGFGRCDRFISHPDRVLDFNVFIYTIEGSIEVWEDGTEYMIREGEIFPEGRPASLGGIKDPARNQMVLDTLL